MDVTRKNRDKNKQIDITRQIKNEIMIYIRLFAISNKKTKTSELLFTKYTKLFVLVSCQVYTKFKILVLYYNGNKSKQFPKYRRAKPALYFIFYE